MLLSWPEAGNGRQRRTTIRLWRLVAEGRRGLVTGSFARRLKTIENASIVPCPNRTKPQLLARNVSHPDNMSPSTGATIQLCAKAAQL
ncbi:MAG: hypothetical protein U0992_16745 [Planctomycetaceae bacterium]